MCTKIGLGASNIILGGLFGILRGVIVVYLLIFVIEKTSFAEDAVMAEVQFR